MRERERERERELPTEKTGCRLGQFFRTGLTQVARNPSGVFKVRPLCYGEKNYFCTKYSSLVSLLGQLASLSARCQHRRRRSQGKFSAELRNFLFGVKRRLACSVFYVAEFVAYYPYMSRHSGHRACSEFYNLYDHGHRVMFDVWNLDIAPNLY